MANQKEKETARTVVINGEEHNVNDLSQEQIAYYNQCMALQQKSANAEMELGQLVGAREFFAARMTDSLKAEPEAEAASAGE